MCLKHIYFSHNSDFSRWKLGQPMHLYELYTNVPFLFYVVLHPVNIDFLFNENTPFVSWFPAFKAWLSVLFQEEERQHKQTNKKKRLLHRVWSRNTWCHFWCVSFFFGDECFTLLPRRRRVTTNWITLCILEGSCSNISQISACLLNTSTLVHVHTSSRRLSSLGSAVGGKRKNMLWRKLLPSCCVCCHIICKTRRIFKWIIVPTGCLCTVVTIEYQLLFLLSRKMRLWGSNMNVLNENLCQKSLTSYSLM